jgi:hypothetical protein
MYASVVKKTFFSDIVDKVKTERNVGFPEIPSLKPAEEAMHQFLQCPCDTNSMHALMIDHRPIPDISSLIVSNYMYKTDSVLLVF